MDTSVLINDFPITSIPLTFGWGIFTPISLKEKTESPILIADLTEFEQQIMDATCYITVDNLGSIVFVNSTGNIPMDLYRKLIQQSLDLYKVIKISF